MKIKLILVLTVISALFFTFSAQKVDSFLKQDRITGFEIQSRSEIYAYSTTIQNILLNATQKISFISGEKKDHSLITPFQAFAILDIKQGRLNTITHFLTGESADARNLKKEELIPILSSNYFENKYTLLTWKNAESGNLLFGVGVKHESTVWFFIGSQTIIQNYINVLKGGIGEIQVVDISGNVLSHMNKEYIGVKTSIEWVTEQLKQKQFSGVNSDYKGNSVVLYSQVPESNVFVIKSAKHNEIYEGASKILWQLALLAIGIILIGAAILNWIFEKNINLFFPKSNSNTELSVSEKVISEALGVDVNGDNSLENYEVEKLELGADDKFKLYTQVASGITHELRMPLLAILGESLMSDPKIEVIQSLARKCKETLDKLLSFAGENAKEEKVKMKIESPLLVSLKKYEKIFSEKNIQLTKNIPETNPIPMHQSQLQSAFEEVINNSIEAMERMPNKELKIDIEETKDSVVLKITDNGEGIDPTHLAQIFDPFYTSRGYLKHMGMGLTRVMSICTEHNCQVSVNSNLGKGTCVQLKFAKPKEVEQAGIQSDENINMAKDESTIQVASELPQELPALDVSETERKAEVEKHKEKITARKNSPLDMDVDELLSMSENSTHKNLAIDPNDELVFIDDFMEQPIANKKINSNVNAAKAKADIDQQQKGKSVSEQSPSADKFKGHGNQPVQEVAQLDKIGAPQFSTQKSSKSKLDKFKIEVRRPGER